MVRRSWMISVAFALAACSPHAGATSSRASGEGSFHRPPVIDGSRRACLEPPFTPGASATLPDGTPVTRGDEGRFWRIALAGERDASTDEIQASLAALREQPDLRFLSHGLCGAGPDLCLTIEVNLCEAVIEHVVSDVRAGLARVPELAGARMDLQISLVGNLGPRCDASDRDCGPIPYEHDARFDPLGSRIGGAFASHSGGACAHHGDCMVMGCGNHCLSWEHGGAHEGATCEGYSFPRPVFCGCVDDVCQWFAQR